MPIHTRHEKENKAMQQNRNFVILKKRRRASHAMKWRVWGGLLLLILGGVLIQSGGSVLAATTVAPTLSTIPNQSMNEDSLLGPISFTISDPDTPPTSLSLYADSSDLSLVPLTRIVFGGNGTERTFTITPASEQSGTSLITIIVSDGRETSQRSFTLTVLNVDDTPTISTIPRQSLQSGRASGPIPISVNDVDTQLGKLTLSAVAANPALLPPGSFIFGGTNGSRTVEITSPPGVEGSTPVTVTVSDGNSSAHSFFTVDIVPANQPPFLSTIDDQTMIEETPITITFLASDPETPGDSLKYLAVSSNQTLMPNASMLFGGSGNNRTLTLSPKQDRLGESEITVTVSDGELSASRTFKIVVNAYDDPPTIVDIPTQTLNEDTTVDVNFSFADVDTPANGLVVTVNSTNSTLLPNNRLILKRTGLNATLTINPAPDQSGEAVVIINVSDGNSSVVDTFLVRVLSVNDLPQVVPFENQVTSEDKPLDPISFVIQDVETSPDDLIVTASSSNKSLVADKDIVLGGSGRVRTLLITPMPNVFGVTTISLFVDDGEGVGKYTFRLTVESVNDQPEVTPISDVTVAEDTAATVIFVVRDVETPFSQLTYSAIAADTKLLPTANMKINHTQNDSRLVITPAPNLFGSTLVTLTVVDGSLTVLQSFQVTVTPVNDPPMISKIQDQGTPENTSLKVNLSVVDVDNDANSLVFTFGSSNATLLPVANINMTAEEQGSVLTLVPATGQSGKSTVSVTVSDGLQPATMTFILTVHAYPTIAAIADQTTPEDEPITVTVTIDDRDSPLTSLQLTADSSNIQLVPKKNLVLSGTGNQRLLRLQPALDLFGTTIISLTVTDGVLSTKQAFKLTVVSMEDPPTIDPIPDATIDQDKTFTYNLNVKDGDTPPSGITITANSSNPQLVPLGSIQIDGSANVRGLLIQPAPGRAGMTTITLTASDGQDQFSRSFKLFVNGAPGFAGVADLTMPEDTVKPMGFTVTDSDNPAETLVVAVTSANQDLLPNNTLIITGSGASRILILSPRPDQFGIATLTMTVSDGRLTTTKTFVVTVSPVNDSPTIRTIEPQVTDEDVALGPLPITIDDSDTELSKLQLFVLSSNNKLIPEANITLGGIENNRTVTIQPSPNLSGTSRITITVSDGSLSASTFFTLTVRDVNDAPTIAPLLNRETLEDVPITVTITIDDIDSPMTMLNLSGQSAHPKLVDSSDMTFTGTGKTRVMTVTPQKDQAGVVRLTVTANDGGLSSSTSFTLTIININDSPTIDPIPDQIMDEDTVLTVTVQLRDIDNTPDQLSTTIASSDIRLMPLSRIQWSGTGSERALALRPTRNRYGELVITLTVTDGEYTHTLSFKVTVRETNDPPDAVDDTYTIITLPEMSFGVLANDFDVDLDPFKVTSVGQPRIGTVLINRDNTLRFKMPPAFTGQDVFTYTINDGRGGQDTAQVTINVVEPPGPNTPEIHAIDPPIGLNDRSVEITIKGINFEQGASAQVGPFPLSNIRVLDSKTVKAFVPAFLTPDRYDVIIANPDGRTAVRTGAYQVDTDKIALIQVRPNRGQVDLPVNINVYGLNFDEKAVTLIGDKPLATSFVSSKHLQAVVPPGFVLPGRYAMTVLNPDGQRFTVADAYTVYTADSDDLYAYAYELWASPSTLHTGQSVQLLQRVRRAVGKDALTDVAVDFYINMPYQESTLIGRALVPLLVSNDDSNSRDVVWTPPSAGSFTIYAVIDPGNKVKESDENNNLIKRTVTVLPTIVDMEAPHIDELVINNGAATTQSRQISVRVRASDTEHPVQAVYFVEYEYIRGADQWVAVQWSDWLPYTGTPTTYEWTLLSSPGIKYIQAWATDERGNSMSQPQLAAINYAPASEDSLSKDELRLYRYPLTAGEQLSAFLLPTEGDPDLYVWPPDAQVRPPWITNLTSGVDELGFVAPVGGTFQLEISGYTRTRYQSAVELRSALPRTGYNEKSNIDPSKPRRANPYIPVFDMPAQEYRLPSSPAPAPEPEEVLSIYLPLMVGSVASNSVTLPKSVDPAEIEPSAISPDATPYHLFLPQTQR